MSDEIPVGSPPAPPGRHAAPGGWYADPVDEQRERYWDGWQWTRNVRPRAGARPVEPTSPTESPYGPGPAPYGAPGAGMVYRMVPTTADGVPLAGWWWRAAAAVVDYFLLSAVVQLISAITPLGAGVARGQNAASAYFTEVLTTGGEMDFAFFLQQMNTPELIIVNVITTVLFIVYSALMLRARGATLGKMLFRLRVVPVDEGTSAPGLAPAKAWVRPAVTELLSLIPFASLVDYLFPLWDRKKQTLHDKIVRTQVVREERR
ncbi:MAG TPA: RDD family protein [Propionibacterium sp.]|nr:RDD family protein [Propionibacterium sp.]